MRWARSRGRGTAASGTAAVDGRGRLHHADTSFAAALDRLADRLSIEIMVEYLVPEGPRRGDVQVGVRKPGARVVGLGVR